MQADKPTDMSDIENDLDEEPGEEVESVPPLRVGEERELGSSGIKKKLLKRGRGWETPGPGDEATGKSLSGHSQYLVAFVGFLGFCSKCVCFDCEE